MATLLKYTEGLEIRIYLLEVESLRVQSFMASALHSREEPDISLSIVNGKVRLHQLYTCALRA